MIAAWGAHVHVRKFNNEDALETAHEIERFMTHELPAYSRDRLQTFEQTQCVCTAMSILSMELQAANVYNGGTYEVVLGALKHNQEPTDMADEYNVEGSQNAPSQWRRMIWQCVLAMRYLEAQTALTPAAVLETHALLMFGARGGPGAHESTSTGYRTHNACAGEFSFMPPQDIQEKLELTLKKFENAIQQSTEHPVRIASDLLVDFVTVHPFANGNGRMCRILFAYALKRSGFPGTCALTSPGSKAHKDYIKAIQRAQQSLVESKRYDMYWMALYSVGASVANARFVMGDESANKRHEKV
eukprot:CAMPEP_0206037384 /NCGR_PEP_ID=MMETSP1466-20131121/3404_1 /ASSEMBLY_ACC=CAM_ASM_001126 /TAXON_ID=44452 /ORGANISM="Pavlova gyrans, Strain CCMP608" /LENGTH=300 /DNA_ID=CAMNT_0053411935 /DNA_START=15 /DNA_END=917 /DNA_ORIENTATION=+